MTEGGYNLDAERAMLMFWLGALMAADRLEPAIREQLDGLEERRVEAEDGVVKAIMAADRVELNDELLGELVGGQGRHVLAALQHAGMRLPADEHYAALEFTDRIKRLGLDKAGG
jgi:hypothetical protein